MEVFITGKKKSYYILKALSGCGSNVENKSIKIKKRIDFHVLS